MIQWRAMFAALLIMVVGLATFGCSDSGGGEESPPTNPGTGLPEITAIMGQALDASGAGMAGVTVRGSGVETTTGADGKFQLDAPAADNVVVTFEKPGFLRGIKRVNVLEGTPTALRVTLVAEAPPVDLDSTMGGAAAGARNAAVTAPAGAFVDQNGAAVAGTVQVHLTPLDPSVDAELAAYPGDLRAAQADGTPTQLETFGVLDVTIRQGGENLQIGSGQSVDIKIPAPASTATTPPATIGLWSFDEANGVWVEEGVATYNATDNTYDATITHLSPWNADMPLDSTCISGNVVDQYGNAIPGAYVEAKGVGYLGWSSTVADANGEFCVIVRKDSQIQVTAIHPLGGGTIREVSSGSAGTSVPPNCATCDNKGTWVVEQGVVTGPGGGTVDCATINTPYIGTCAEGMIAIFTCFNPQGACTYNTSTGQITYENGARMTAGGLGGEFYSATGALCGSYAIDASNPDAPKVNYSDATGQTWKITVASETGDQVIECPNGETYVITSQEMATLQACSGGGGGGSEPTQECTIEGGGLPTPCTVPTDCAAGEVCCPSIGYCLPDIPGICDAA